MDNQMSRLIPLSVLLQLEVFEARSLTRTPNCGNMQPLRDTRRSTSAQISLLTLLILFLAILM